MPPLLQLIVGSNIIYCTTSGVAEKSKSQRRFYACSMMSYREEPLYKAALQLRPTPAFYPTRNLSVNCFFLPAE